MSLQYEKKRYARNYNQNTKVFSSSRRWRINERPRRKAEVSSTFCCSCREWPIAKCTALHRQNKQNWCVSTVELSQNAAGNWMMNCHCEVERCHGMRYHEAKHARTAEVMCNMTIHCTKSGSSGCRSKDAYKTDRQTTLKICKAPARSPASEYTATRVPTLRFLQDVFPSWQPANSVKALKVNSISHSHLEDFSTLGGHHITLSPCATGQTCKLWWTGELSTEEGHTWKQQTRAESWRWVRWLDCCVR